LDTSLVHEAYLRLVRPEALQLNDRSHFFAVAAHAMRQIAVDPARGRLAAKRGSGAPETTLGAADYVTGDDSRHESTMALNESIEALKVLEAAAPRLAQMVELRFFGGMSLDEAGEVLGLSPTTLKRDFRKARAFLHARLGAELLDEPDA
jgi:RNA polymerase sigma factor (TIGR02999 family)